MAPTPLPLDVVTLRHAWGSPDFERILTADLQAHWQQLPLERACENGGLPDEPRFHNFRSAEAEPDKLAILFDAVFRERLSPGCGGRAEEQIRFAGFLLTIARSGCVIEHRERLAEPEF